MQQEINHHAHTHTHTHTHACVSCRARTFLQPYSKSATVCRTFLFVAGGVARHERRRVAGGAAPRRARVSRSRTIARWRAGAGPMPHAVAQLRRRRRRGRVCVLASLSAMRPPHRLPCVRRAAPPATRRDTNHKHGVGRATASAARRRREPRRRQRRRRLPARLDRAGRASRQRGRAARRATHQNVASGNSSKSVSSFAPCIFAPPVVESSPVVDSSPFVAPLPSSAENNDNGVDDAAGANVVEIVHAGPCLRNVRVSDDVSSGGRCARDARRVGDCRHGVRRT